MGSSTIQPSARLCVKLDFTELTLKDKSYNKNVLANVKTIPETLTKIEPGTWIIQHPVAGIVCVGAMAEAPTYTNTFDVQHLPREVDENGRTQCEWTVPIKNKQFKSKRSKSLISSSVIQKRLNNLKRHFNTTQSNMTGRF